METISHILIFYLGARFGKLKVKWIGMITAIIADVFLLIVWSSGSLLGLSIPSYIWGFANLLHSVFVILIFLPLLYYGKNYFLSASLGAYSHIFLDIFTHNAEIPVFFPLSNYRPDFFIIYTLNPILIVITHMILFPIVLFLEKSSFLEFITNVRKKVRFFDYLFMFGSFMILLLSIVVFFRLIGPSYMALYVIFTIIFTIDAIFAFVILARECLSEPSLAKLIFKIMEKMRLIV